MRTAMLVAVSVFAFLSGTVAQERTLQPGQKVRVSCSAAGVSRVVGYFQQIENDSLVLAVERTFTDRRTGAVQRGAAQELRIALEDVTRVAVHAGTASNRGTSTAIGFLLGVLIGGAAGFSSGDDPPGIMSMSAEDKAAGGALVLGLVGGVVGFFAGGSTDKWEEVPLDQVRVGIAPRARGFGLGASIEF